MSKIGKLRQRLAAIPYFNTVNPHKKRQVNFPIYDSSGFSRGGQPTGSTQAPLHKEVPFAHKDFFINAATSLKDPPAVNKIMFQTELKRRGGNQHGLKWYQERSKKDEAGKPIERPPEPLDKRTWKTRHKERIKGLTEAQRRAYPKTKADLTKIRPPKPTQADRARIIKAKQIKQRIARLRTAKPIIQETGEGIDFIRRSPKGPTKGRTYGWHKIPMHPSNAILIRPNKPAEQMDMIKHFRKIQNTKDFAPQVHGSVQQFLPLRHLRNNVMHMSGQPFKRHATISRAQGKSFKKGDIVMRRVGGKPEEGRYGTVGDTFYIEQDSPKGEMYTAKVRLA